MKGERMLEKIKNLPPEEKAIRAEIFKEILSAILYFVMLNNPKLSGMITIAMRIFKISDEKILEYDNIMDNFKS